ncbi:MAG: hypothetical protein RL213_869 [Bacteroidota bacterium]|jgi:hypothetical protein
MKHPVLRHLLSLTVFALLVAAVFTACAGFFPSLFDVTYRTALGTYFFLLSILFHLGLVRATAGRPAAFIRFYMAATSFKLFIHLGILVFFALLHKDQLVPFTLSFLLHYLFFTVFEVFTAFRQSKQ